jgi:hypothetical protein
MADRDRDERGEDALAAAILQAQTDREQPSHRGIDAMVRAEQRDGEPRPGAGHG